MASTRDDGAPMGPAKGAEVKEFRATVRGRKCPICGAAAAIATRPFCSKRCADLDLGNWLGDRYRIPTEEPADGGEESGPDGGPQSGQGSGDEPSDPAA